MQPKTKPRTESIKTIRTKETIKTVKNAQKQMQGGNVQSGRVIFNTAPQQQGGSNVKTGRIMFNTTPQQQGGSNVQSGRIMFNTAPQQQGGAVEKQLITITSGELQSLFTKCVNVVSSLNITSANLTTASNEYLHHVVDILTHVVMSKKMTSVKLTLESARMVICKVVSAYIIGVNNALSQLLKNANSPKINTSTTALPPSVVAKINDIFNLHFQKIKEFKQYSVEVENLMKPFLAEVVSSLKQQYVEDVSLREIIKYIVHVYTVKVKGVMQSGGMQNSVMQSEVQNGGSALFATEVEKFHIIC